jgi:hypothetical protein
VPEELGKLKPEERRRVYGLLRLEVSALPDGTLEARGILGESLQVGSENGRAVCEPELALSCIAGWRMQRNILRYRRPSPLGPPPYSSHLSRRSLSHASRNLSAAILASMSPSVSSSTSL